MCCPSCVSTGLAAVESGVFSLGHTACSILVRGWGLFLVADLGGISSQAGRESVEWARWHFLS